MSRTTTLARFAILGAALLFSTGGTVIKATSISAFPVAAARSGLAALLLFALAPQWRAFWRPRPLLVGVGYAATMVLFVAANKSTTAANAIFLQASAPLYVLALAPWLLGEQNRRRDFALTGTLAVGLVLFFVGTEAPARTAPDPSLGNLLAAVSGVTWACTLVGLRWLAQAAPSPIAGDGATRTDEAGAAVIAGNVLAFAACLPLSLPPPEVGATDLLLLAYLGTFQIGLAYVLLTRGVRSLPALDVALLMVLEPVLSSFWAFVVHHEVPGAWALAGCAVILAATVARIVWQAAEEPEH